MIVSLVRRRAECCERPRAVGERAARRRRARGQTRALATATVVLFVAVGLVLGFDSPLVLAGGGSSAFASNRLVRTVQERTVMCNTPVDAGRHTFQVFFSPAYARSGTPAFLGVASRRYTMIGVVARKLQAPPTTSGGFIWPALPSTNAGVSVTRGHCAQTNAHVPLARSGLPGPPVRYDHYHHCILDGRLLIRARAVRDGNGFRAELAVRIARTRRPIAFATIARDGTGGVYISNRCTLTS
jgi:hypothetical protein